MCVPGNIGLTQRNSSAVGHFSSQKRTKCSVIAGDSPIVLTSCQVDAASSKNNIKPLIASNVDRFFSPIVRAAKRNCKDWPIPTEMRQRMNILEKIVPLPFCRHHREALVLVAMGADGELIAVQSRQPLR